jgi:putative SOS response-associated peptidase YedK
MRKYYIKFQVRDSLQQWVAIAGLFETKQDMDTVSGFTCIVEELKKKHNSEEILIDFLKELKDA